MRYAENTSVSEDRSRAEIERMLMKHGADEFGYVTRTGEAVVAFVFRGIRVQMSVKLPLRDAKRFHITPGRGKARSESAAFDEWQKEVRRRWRSLRLVIKALLVGVDDGVLSFEQAFMPWMVWGDGRTTWEAILPAAEAYLKEGRGLPDLGSSMRLLEADQSQSG